jgi:hypothetical protein
MGDVAPGSRRCGKTHWRYEHPIPAGDQFNSRGQRPVSVNLRIGEASPHVKKLQSLGSRRARRVPAFLAKPAAPSGRQIIAHGVSHGTRERYESPAPVGAKEPAPQWSGAIIFRPSGAGNAKASLPTAHALGYCLSPLRGYGIEPPALGQRLWGVAPGSSIHPLQG